MDLNQQQKRALQHAREVLAEDPGRCRGALDSGWHSAIRGALRDLIAAVEPAIERQEADGEDEEPVPHEFPAAYHAPWEPGECHGCGGHADHDGSWHEAGAA